MPSSKNYDIITIGTATRDVFLTSLLFSAKGGSASGGKVLRDKKPFEKIGFVTGEAQCFALGGKIEIGKPVLATGGGATNSAATFSRQGLKTAVLIKIGEDQAGKDILEELKKEKLRYCRLISNFKFQIPITMALLIQPFFLHPAAKGQF